MWMERLSATKHAWSHAVINKLKDTFAPMMDVTMARIIFAFDVIWDNPQRHGDIPVA
jgi:hypothetical protein